MDVSTRVAMATVFVWLGMVLAISFVEAPLKFRAPGVTLRIGLGIGRLVFRALNACEFVFAVVIAFALFTHAHDSAARRRADRRVGALFLQTVVLRPMLTRRTTAVLAGRRGSGVRAPTLPTSHSNSSR